MVGVWVMPREGTDTVGVISQTTISAKMRVHAFSRGRTVVQAPEQVMCIFNIVARCCILPFKVQCTQTMR